MGARWVGEGTRERERQGDRGKGLIGDKSKRGGIEEKKEEEMESER